MNRGVIQIVPQLRPPPEGVGNFAVSLAAALRNGSRIESRFFVASPTWVPESADAEIPALKIPRADPIALCRMLEDAAEKNGQGATVLLHYANYGYQKRGCPAWLIAGLKKWKTGNQGRLVTIFHEFQASGLPWRSSFWLSWRQRRLAVALARLSDGLATSMLLYRRILLRWLPDREIAVLPVVSTVGEPSATAPLANRARRLVVFGGRETRARAFHELREELEFSCRALGIEEVCEVGAGDSPATPELSVRLRRLGPLPDADVSELLANSLAGFTAYPAPFLSKSTVFAAFCAHRVLPICAWPRARSARREVEPGTSFWEPGEDTRPDQLQELADRAYGWYQGHALDRQVAHYQGLLFP